MARLYDARRSTTCPRDSAPTAARFRVSRRSRLAQYSSVIASHGSYRLHEHFSDVEAELVRLEAQAANVWPKESEVLRRQGLPPDARVLEVGCGPGFVTERLLALVPDGSVTGIDNDPAMIELGRQRLGERENVDLREASVAATGLPDDSFDAATARLVFQHLPDPMPALAELRRVLRSGGRLFVTDIDSRWGLLLDPEPPHYDEINAAIAGIRVERGGNPAVGRRLPRMLAEAGFSDLALDVVAIHTVIDGGDSVPEVIGGVAMLEPLVDPGFLTREAFEAAREFAQRFESGELEVDGLLGLLVVSGAA
jgi:SAM-dependent methyltransferase